jgi:hypothetical protein
VVRRFFMTQAVAGGKRPSLAQEPSRPVAEKLAILVKGWLSG